MVMVKTVGVSLSVKKLLEHYRRVSGIVSFPHASDALVQCGDKWSLQQEDKCLLLVVLSEQSFHV